MAKIQRWEIPLDGETHHITYKRRALSRKVCMEIDGESFTLPRTQREEIFRLGDEQAILCVDRKGRATIRLRDGVIEEI